MSENKYESLLAELTNIQTQASVILSKYKDTSDRNLELEETLSELKKENEELNKKLSKIEKEIEKLKGEREENLFNSLNSKERESLKIKIQDLISKINLHLSS